MRRAVFLCCLMPGLALAQSQEPARYGFGRVPDVAEIARWDIDVSPDGRGLPRGSGTPDRGRAVYQQKCRACHGAEGQGGPNDVLVGAFEPSNDFAADRRIRRAIGNYWPYATTLYDYIYRAMPFATPGSLVPDEVYALTAYLLHLNGIVERDAVIDAQTQPAIEMPARAVFYYSDEVD